jgi:hypothetical protein
MRLFFKQRPIRRSKGGFLFERINYLPKNQKISRIISEEKTIRYLGNTVRKICPDNRGKLWLATEITV